MNQKQGLSVWSIVFLFAEPFVVWQGETRWGNWIRGPSAPGWLPLAKSSILMQVPLTTIVGVVVVAVMLELTCFRYQQMRLFLKVYVAASLILAVPGCLVLALMAARAGGIGETISHYQLVGHLTGNLFVDGTSFIGAPWLVYTLFPWLFYDYLPFVFVLGLPFVCLNQILSLPSMLIVLCFPPWLILSVFFLYVVVTAGYAFLPDETKGWICNWWGDTWNRIRHRE